MTSPPPDGPVTTVYDAAEHYAAAGHAAGRAGRQGVRLRLLARLGGQGHGAARGQGRHRRELRADPPLEPDRHGRAAAAVPRRARTPTSLGLTGEETFAVTGVTALNDGTTPTTVAGHATGAGDPVIFDAVVRIDTPGEADYYRHGGIMQYVLRSLLK